MKKIVLLLVLTVILLAGCSSNKARPVDKLKFPPLNEIKVPEVVTHTLSNGMKVYFLVDNRLPIIRMEAQAHSGTVTDPKDKIGLAELASSSLTSSSQKYSAQELKEILNDNAISLGSYASTRHSIVSMSALVEDKDLAFTIFSDVLKNPTFDEEEFETEKTRTISNIYRRNDEASSIAFREFQKVIFGQDYPRNYQKEIYTVENITRDDVQRFYSEYFYPKNMTLTIHGDFDIEEVKSELEFYFSTWYSPLEYKEITLPEPKTDSDTNVYIVDKKDASQTWVLIGHRSNLLYSDDDYPAMQLLNEILGGGFTSRVYKSVRVKKGLSYSPAAFLSASFNSPGALYLLAPTATENTLEAAQTLVEEVRIITQEKVSKEELQFAKDSYFNSFVFKYERPEYTLNAIKNYDYFGYDRDFANILKEKIEDVTIDDIYQVAKKYLKPEELIYLFVGNKDEFIEDVSTLGDVEVIDISLKETKSGDILDYAKGKEIFSKFLNQVKSKKEITSLSSKSTITQSTPMGDMSLDKTTHIVFPNKLLDKIESPMGEISTTVNIDKGIQSMPGRNMELPQENLTAILDQIHLSYFGWLHDPSKLSIGYLQDEIIDDVEYQILKLEYKDSSMKLWINKENSLPGFSVETMDSPSGAMKVKSTFSDYKLNDSVLCPMHIETTLIDGTPINSTSFKSIKFNVEFSDDTFEY